VTPRAGARAEMNAAREVLTALGAIVTGMSVVPWGQQFALRARIAKPLVGAELPTEVNGVQMLVVIDTPEEESTREQ
jgi:hypothetical protein